MKAIRLLLAAIATLILCSTTFYLVDPTRIRSAYRCWRLAVAVSSCFTGDDFEFEIELNGVRYQGKTGNAIDSHIFFYGAFEKPILFFLRDTMESAYSNGGVFLDIGANTGPHSLFMSKHAREIHAFEPWPPVLERFRRMVERNHIKNIIIHPFGLGDENSRKTFFKPPDKNLGTGSFVAGFTESNSYAGELEIRIGDDVLESDGVTAVALIKMDIEGYEKPALKGLRRMLVRDRPVVEFELTIDPKSPLSIKSFDELVSLFPETYEFLVFSEKQDPMRGTYSFDAPNDRFRFDKWQQFDVVAYPAEKKNKIPIQGTHR